MAVFKRPGSPKYYMKFIHEGKQIYLSCKTTNETLAKKRERDERGRLEKIANTPADQRPLPPAPTLRAFAQPPNPDDADMPNGGRWWVDFGTNKLANSPRTHDYYCERLQALLSFKPLADDAGLDEIDEALLDKYSTWRQKTVKGATVNRDFSVLRALMNVARRWKLIRSLPEFPHFKEKRVGRAITIEQELIYLAAVDQDHRDFCAILSNSGMEPGMAAELQWNDVHFQAVGRYTNGYIFDRCQKNEFRERELGMTSPLAKILKERWMRNGRPKSGYVFPSDQHGKTKPTPLATFQSTHKRLWYKTPEHEPLAIPKFRLYDFRHTALTRAVRSGANAFELKQMAGWSSIRMADNYIHLDSQSRAKAADRLSDYLESENARVAQQAAASSKGKARG